MLFFPWNRWIKLVLLFIICTHGTYRSMDFAHGLVSFQSSLSVREELKNHSTLIAHRLQKWCWCWCKGNVVHTTYVLYLELINLKKTHRLIHMHTHTNPCCCKFKQKLLLCAVSLLRAVGGMRPKHHWGLSVTETYPPGAIIIQTKLFGKGY